MKNLLALGIKSREVFSRYGCYCAKIPSSINLQETINKNKLPDQFVTIFPYQSIDLTI